jgi:hypothetical protein
MLMEMVQLRWLAPNSTLTSVAWSPKLQYRFITPNVDASGAMCPPGVWSDWIDVPTVIAQASEDGSQGT